MQNFATAIHDAACKLDEHEKAEVASERQGTSLMTKRKSKTEQVEQDQSEREAILDERETLKRLFPATYSPDIGVFSDGKVEVMFKLTISQAQSLASLLKEHRL